MKRYVVKKLDTKIVYLGYDITGKIGWAYNAPYLFESKDLAEYHANAKGGEVVEWNIYNTKISGEWSMPEPTIYTVQENGVITWWRRGEDTPLFAVAVKLFLNEFPNESHVCLTNFPSEMVCSGLEETRRFGREIIDGSIHEVLRHG